MIKAQSCTKMRSYTKRTGLEEFIYLRAEIRGQHEIMNHRMSWFAATQSLLYSAYASSAVDKDKSWFSGWLIPVVALLLCILMIPAVMSANERICSLRKVLKSRAPRFWDLYPMNTDLSHYMAQLYPLFAPWIFLSSWLIVLRMGVFR